MLTGLKSFNVRPVGHEAVEFNTVQSQVGRLPELDPCRVRGVLMASGSVVQPRAPGPAGRRPKALLRPWSALSWMAPPRAS